MPHLPSFYTDLSLPSLKKWLLDTAGQPGSAPITKENRERETLEAKEPRQGKGDNNGTMSLFY
jgi:hypothetical protein